MPAKTERNYLVVIPTDTLPYVKRVNDGSPVGRSLAAICGAPLEYRSIDRGLVLVTGEGQTALNARATALADLRGEVLRGDAVLLRLGKDDYTLYTKPAAQAVAEILRCVV